MKRKNKPRRKRVAIDKRLEGLSPSFQAYHVEEPKLVFGGGNLSVDPKSGLARYGPHDSESTGIKMINVGLIGTGSGIGEFLGFLERAKDRLTPGLNTRGKPLDAHTNPDFPGWANGQTFGAAFLCSNPNHQRVIHEEYFKRATAAPNAETKIKEVVGLVMKQMEALNNLDPAPHVIVVVLPPEVENQIAHVGAAMARRKIVLSPKEKFLKSLAIDANKGQLSLDLTFDADEAENASGYWNFHHAFKAHAMAFSAPTQLVWQTTLTNENLASVAWNLLTALYYKAGNSPWRLQMLTDTTCYVGVSFFKSNPFGKADMHTSLAQVFGAGEGIVLQGDKAVFDKSKGDRSPHLTASGSEALLKQALDIFQLQHGAPPTRVVVHKSSRYWPEELQGFRLAVQGIYRTDFLAFGELDTRFMRLGKRPVLRGTVVLLSRGHYLIFTNGYIPYLRSYPSKRIPRPLEIIEHHGDTPPLSVCSEILALTKLNWNSCWFGSISPITLRFARDVGRVLAELPKDGSIKPKTKYKYYM
jgi:hypothetical protein